MKTPFLKSAFLVALTAGIFTGCVNDDDYKTPTLAACTETTLVANREVSDIAASETVKLHENITPGVSDVIEAYITSSDVGGNFFKSISFQTLDGSKAFAIPVDQTSLFINYEPGRKVLIKMDGLYTDINDGSLRIGGLYANSSGGAEVGRLPFAQFRTSVQRSCTIVNEDVLVQNVTLADLNTDAYINKLVEVDGVQFDNAAIASTYYDINNDLGGATNLNLTDIDGNSVIFRTSSFANFSAKPVATGRGTVRGVLTKFGDTYQFIARSINDINLNGARFTPLLNEAFTSSLNGWSAFSVTGAQVWTHSPTFGNPGGMAKMSGFASSSNANEDWLISPVQDLTALTTASLSFDNAYKFDGPAIVALISNNYVSGDPNAATWTTLTGATLSTGNYIYANSGPLDITAFTGAGNTNVRVAFKYTSTTAQSSTWEIDNVKISGN
ncbi:MAG TPA: DUF5689 domain-containing protein [Flavobacterium sp.]|nr:DUF5689 domain-containing protein [Flavobacterium sp.]